MCSQLQHKTTVATAGFDRQEADRRVKERGGEREKEREREREIERERKREREKEQFKVSRSTSERGRHWVPQRKGT